MGSPRRAPGRWAGCHEPALSGQESRHAVAQGTCKFSWRKRSLPDRFSNSSGPQTSGATSPRSYCDLGRRLWPPPPHALVLAAGKKKSRPGPASLGGPSGWGSDPKAPEWMPKGGFGKSASVWTAPRETVGLASSLLPDGTRPSWRTAARVRSHVSPRHVVSRGQSAACQWALGWPVFGAREASSSRRAPVGASPGPLCTR